MTEKTNEDGPEESSSYVLPGHTDLASYPYSLTFTGREPLQMQTIIDRVGRTYLRIDDTTP